MTFNPPETTALRLAAGLSLSLVRCVTPGQEELDDAGTRAATALDEDLEVERFVEAEAQAEKVDCTGTSPKPSGLVALPPREREAGPGDSLRITVRGPLAEGELSMRASVLSDGVLTDRGIIGTWPVETLPRVRSRTHESDDPGLRDTVVSVNVADLGLDSVGSPAGQVIITPEIGRETGETVGPDAATQIVYHREGENWRFYSVEERQGQHKAVWEELHREALNAPAVPDSSTIPEAVLASMGDDDEAIDTAHAEWAAGSEPATGSGNDHFSAQPTPQAAHVKIDVCAKMWVQYTDSSVGEDYWTSPIYQRGWLGGYYDMYVGGSWYRGDFLGDGINTGSSGCTGDVWVPSGQTVELKIYPFGAINGNGLTVYDAAGQGPFYGGSTGWPIPTVLVGTVNQGGKYTRTVHTVTGWDRVGDKYIYANYNVYRALSRAMWRHNGGLSGYYYSIGTNADHASNKTELEDRDSVHKFPIVHEYGHQVNDHRYPGGTTSYTFGYDAQSSQYGDPTCTFNGTHRSRSQEWESAAGYEGFADFVAIDCWNNHGTSANCQYQSSYGCSGATLPIGVQESWCQNDYQLQAFGSYQLSAVEADWARTFWAAHTGNASTPGANMAEIIDLIWRSRDTWVCSGSCTYGNDPNGWCMDRGADCMFGAAFEAETPWYLRTNWIDASNLHGLVQ